MTKLELIKNLEELDDDVEIYFYCEGFQGYAQYLDFVAFQDKVTGKLQNEITIVVKE